MTARAGTGPALQEGEEVIFDHIPSLRSFQLTALVLIGLTLPVAVVFGMIFAETVWPALPVFLTCMILLQERFRLGRYRAWITGRRIILQGGEEVAMEHVGRAEPRGTGVRVIRTDGARPVKLHYAADRAALAGAINRAKGGAA